MKLAEKSFIRLVFGVIMTAVAVHSGNWPTRSSRSRRPQELRPHSSPLPSPHISADLIHYVSVFVPDHSGHHYVPHVSIGIGTIDFLTTFSSAPFDDFTFSPAGASVYHLREYGTAMKKSHSFTFKK
jgi:hypothetical protein